MRRCDEALDAMTTLAHAFKTVEYQAYLSKFAASMDDNGSYFDVEKEAILPGSAGGGDALVRASMVNVEVSEPVWCNEDVVHLVEHAAIDPTFQPEAIEAHDIWTPHAFCLLQRPMFVLDIKGKRLGYRGISWSISRLADGGEGVMICKWSHVHDQDDYTREKGEMPTVGGSPYLLAHVGVIPFGEARFLRSQLIADAVAQYESLWRLAKQHIVVQSPEPVSRHARKRAAKWRHIPEVTVLRLRRVKYVGGENGRETGRTLSVRSIVHGFWRDEHYPSLGPARLPDGSSNPASHKQKWIHEFQRGPADAPLVLKRHGTEFDR